MSKVSRGLLVVMGVAMLVIGAFTAIAGVGPSVPREGIVTPDVQSEMRFYGVWYSIVGGLLLLSLRDGKSERRTVIAIGIGFLAAGSVRALSWIVDGRPHGWQIGLMIVELVLGPGLIVWQWRRNPEGTR